MKNNNNTNTREIAFRAFENDPLFESPMMHSWEDLNRLDREGLLHLCDIINGDSKTTTLMQYTGLIYQGVKCFCGDIIDINQTVNGQSRFVIMGCIGSYDVRYAHDLEREYEYNISELLDIGKDDSEIKILGNVYEHLHLLNQ